MINIVIVHSSLLYKPTRTKQNNMVGVCILYIKYITYYSFLRGHLAFDAKGFLLVTEVKVRVGLRYSIALITT